MTLWTLALGWLALGWLALGWQALGWQALGWQALGWQALGWQALGVAIVSGLLLAINAVGILSRGRVAVRSATRQPRTISQLLSLLPSPASSDPDTFCRQLNRQLAQRFQHGYGRYRLTGNYLAWLAGRLLPRLGEIQTTPVLLRESDQALCGQLAQAFVDVTSRAGVTARIVALPGHIVAEAHYEGNWHGFDPDYGVEYAGADETIVSVAELMGDPERARDVYREHRLPRGSEEVLSILQSGTAVYLPAGAHAVPRIARLQQSLEVLKWLLPVVLLIAAAAACLTGTFWHDASQPAISMASCQARPASPPPATPDRRRLSAADRQPGSSGVSGAVPSFLGPVRGNSARQVSPS